MISPSKFRTREARRKARQRLLILCLLYVLAGVVITTGIVWILHQPALRIERIVVETDGVLTPTTLIEELETEISGTHFTLLPKDSVLAVRPHMLAASIAERTPRIKSISAEHTTFRTLVFSVTERTQHAWWCGDIVPSVPTTSTSTPLYGRCYAVDATGIIYADTAEAPNASTSHVYYGPLTHANPIGTALLPQDDFIHLDLLYSILAAHFPDAYALLIADARDVEFFRHDGSRVILPRTMEPDTLDSRLAALINSNTVDASRTLAYLDMRFGAKIFLRYHDDEEPAQVLTATTSTHTQESL